MKPLIVLNWKMKPQTIVEAKKIFDATKKAVEKNKKIDVVIAPPALFLPELINNYRGKRIAFAVQNVHTEKEGSFTGEISAPEAKSIGAQYAIVGHAERRAYGETNEEVGKKASAALDAGLTAIICVGESERDSAGMYLHTLKQQIEAAIAEVPKNEVKHIVIAYEPVWAIGRDKAMSGHEMHEVSIYIRKVLFKAYDKAAMNIPILYGGSVDEVKELSVLVEGAVQGLLLGRVSVESTKLKTLLGAIF